VEAKWQHAWDAARLFEANPDPAKAKFFITVAYPYPNSPQHVGHGRTFTITDVYARYKRMRGFNVLFPMAFHYTGTPILAMAKRVASGDPELLADFVNIYHVPKETVQDFGEPIKIADYFHHEIKRGMREIGYSIDWRREFTTIQAPYSRFIQWQFNKLKDKGLITRGSHPVGWCPSCESPMGQHDTKGDVEPEIGEVILVKFTLVGPEDTYLPTGTLRPETLFGVTNLWVRPDLDYVRAQIDGETWIVSQECAEKLAELNYTVTVTDTVAGRSLVGTEVINPLTGDTVPIFPAAFVDPKNATGIVMSVPGHAPFDYIALEDLKQAPEHLVEYQIPLDIVQSMEPISLIHLDGYSAFPALDALTRMGVKNQLDAKLEDATKEVYNKEFHQGTMKAITGPYAGLPVAEARDRVTVDLVTRGQACKMYELLNGPIYCRCGAAVVVKIFEDQWFINYGDTEWKRQAHACLDHMTLIPADLATEFHNVVDWLREKACARKHGLGTRLPWDREWIIESLSDSVIYMSYYTIARLITERQIRPDQLTEAAFDYIFLGIGDPVALEGTLGFAPGVLREMRDEFTYFYPLDSRNSGRDLVPNHLTFFVFNHTAVFPPALWPRQIVVNGSVLMEGKKMSKSFGNIIPLREAIEQFGADPFRVAVLSTAELLQDADFSPTLATAVKERLERFNAFALDVIEGGTDADQDGLDRVDAWMVSRLQQHVKTVTDAMDDLRFRPAVQVALYTLDQDVQWYLRRTPPAKRTQGVVTTMLRRVLEAKVLFLAPFAPHLCEEIWQKMGRTGFVSVAEWPRYDAAQIDASSLWVEDRVQALQEDVAKILRATKLSPKRICFYFAAKWKWQVYLQALTLAANGVLDVGSLMEALMRETALRTNAKRVAAFARKIVADMKQSPPRILGERLQTGYVDEVNALRPAEDYFMREFKAAIDYFTEDDADVYDPKGRASLAEPYRPAIYIE